MKRYILLILLVCQAFAGPPNSISINNVATLANGAPAAYPPPFPTVSTGTLILRLLGSNIDVVADGGPLATWPDSSASGHDATQATSGQQPLYELSSANFNGQPTVIFDGSDDGMLVDDACVLEAPYTLFFVGKALHGATGVARYIQSRDGNYKISFNTTVYSAYLGTGGIQNDSTVLPGSFPALACLTVGDDVVRYLINGELVYLNTGPINDWQRIALNGAGAFGQYAACETAAVIAFSGALDSTDRAAIQLWLDVVFFGGTLGF